MPTNQLPAKGTKNWGDILNSWLGQLGPASLGGIHNGDTVSRPAGLVADDEGRIYIDTESGELIQWGGSAWQVLLSGNQEQKFNITAKTADYTITTTEAETGLNGFSNDGAIGTVVFTLPDAVAGMKVTVVNGENQTLQINSVNDDKIYTSDIPMGSDKLENTTNSTSSIFYCVSDTKWVVMSESWAIPPVLKGYFGGGYNGGAKNDIDNFDFNSEVTASTSATLSVARYTLAAANSENKGYFAGGTGGTSTIDSIEFSDETAINPAATLSLGRKGLSGVNSTDNGYFGGGDTPSNQSTIDGIKFSDESAINPAATLSTARTLTAGINSSTKGYWAGGNWTTTIDGIQFSDDTAINPASTLSLGRQQFAGVSSSTKGYFGGGHTGSAVTNVIDGIQFSDETAINPSATLAVGRKSHSGVNSTTNGYFGGGDNGGSNYIDGIQFSDETAINPSATLAVARWNLASCQSGGTL